MINPVNVIVSGLPHGSGSLCLRLGSARKGVTAGEVDAAIRNATGLPCGALLLRTHARVLRARDHVAPRGDHTAFVRALVRRALPGGKNCFHERIHYLRATNPSPSHAAPAPPCDSQPQATRHSAALWRRGPGVTASGVRAVSTGSADGRRASRKRGREPSQRGSARHGRRFPVGSVCVTGLDDDDDDDDDEYYEGYVEGMRVASSDRSSSSSGKRPRISHVHRARIAQRVASVYGVPATSLRRDEMSDAMSDVV